MSEWTQDTARMELQLSQQLAARVVEPSVAGSEQAPVQLYRYTSATALDASSI